MNWGRNGTCVAANVASRVPRAVHDRLRVDQGLRLWKCVGQFNVSVSGSVDDTGLFDVRTVTMKPPQRCFEMEWGSFTEQLPGDWVKERWVLTKLPALQLIRDDILLGLRSGTVSLIHLSPDRSVLGA